MIQYGISLAGGALIGLSAAILLVLNGRAAGISGIVGSLLQGEQVLVNVAFVAGLMSGPLLYDLTFGQWPRSTMTSSFLLVVIAGLLVGLGTRMGSGCTSGHGVVGLARMSPRSATAVAVFMASGMLTVFVMRVFGL
jgi:uncharacterized membrane protein YedE/YeeE